MKFLDKLGNPFALVVEGFLAGAMVFAAAHPDILRSASDRGDASSEEIVRQLTR